MPSCRCYAVLPRIKGIKTRIVERAAARFWGGAVLRGDCCDGSRCPFCPSRLYRPSRPFVLRRSRPFGWSLLRHLRAERAGGFELCMGVALSTPPDVHISTLCLCRPRRKYATQGARLTCPRDDNFILCISAPQKGIFCHFYILSLRYDRYRFMQRFERWILSQKGTFK